MLATRKLLDLGRLLGNEGPEGGMLALQLVDVQRELVTRPDGLGAPIKELNGGFGLVALA